MKRRLALALLPLVVAGCGGSTREPTQPATSGSSDATVVVESTDGFRFEPARITVDRGDPLRIELRNTGSYPHNLAIPELHLTSDTVTGAFGDTETTFSVDTSKAGRYRFVCTFHDQAGMTGEIVVR